MTATRVRIGRRQAGGRDAQDDLRGLAVRADRRQLRASRVIHDQERRDALGLQADGLLRGGAVGLETVDDRGEVGGDLLEIGRVDAVGGEDRLGLGQHRAQRAGLKLALFRIASRSPARMVSTLCVSFPLAAAAARSSASCSTLEDDAARGRRASALRSSASACFCSSVTVAPGAMARRSLSS